MALDPADLLARARDPSTPGPELERIARALALHVAPGAAADPRGRAVLEALAGNPNAPPALLFWLAEDVPDAVAANPALPLLALENPAVVVAAPVSSLVRLLGCAAIAADWLEHAARHASFHVRAAVASSSRTPAPVLARLADDADWCVRITVAGNPSAPPPSLARLARQAHEAERTYCLDALAANPATPLATLESLAESPAYLPLVAKNFALPAGLVELLAAHGQAEVRAAVAARPDLPAWLERRLAADPSRAVRAAVARRADAPALLARLSLASKARVRVAVLNNPRAPDAVLERLANAPAPRNRALARQRLAARAKAPPA